LAEIKTVGHMENISKKKNQGIVREIVLRQCRGTSLVVSVKINGRSVPAVVDTGANVTVINEELAQSLGKLNVTEHCKLSCAAQSSSMSAKRVQGINLELGKRKFVVDVYVAPITDKVLLGLDFLNAHDCIVNLKLNQIEIDGKSVQAYLKRNSDGAEYQVSCIKAPKRITVPPATIVVTTFKLKQPLDRRKTFVFESSMTKDHPGLLIPSLCVHGSNRLPVQFINSAGRYITVKANEVLGNLIEVDDVVESFDENSNESEISDNECDLRQILTSDVDYDVELKKLQSEMPDHLKNLFERSCIELTIQQSVAVGQLLLKYQNSFSKHDLDLGCFKGIKHHINTGDAAPIRQKMRRTPLGFQEEEKQHLQKMLDIGVIRPSNSEWASPPVLVRKKDGSVRWCIDYRALNDCTVKDSFPLPNLDEVLDCLAGSYYFSTLDLASGFYQIELDEESCKKTAFVTRYGLFEHVRLGMGLCNSPSSFQRVMQFVLKDLVFENVLVYMDDICCLGTDFEHHLGVLEKVLERMKIHNLKLKPKKCSLFKSELQFLGKMVTRDGVKIAPDKIESVSNWPVPKCVKDVESFLGFMNYHRDHIQNYAQLSHKLYELTGPKVKFEWTEVHQKQFDELKLLMTSAPCLAYPLPQGQFILDTDASDKSIGAELTQIQDGKPKVIGYASMVLTPSQRKYCTTRKELLAVVTFTRHFRHYLLCNKFLLRTDHNSLTWLMRFKHIEGQLSRWLEELQQYQMQILHRPGKLHGNADGLSRIPDNLEECNCYEAGVDISQLPCGGCPYCERAHKQWSRFEVDVDDVIPLAVRSISLSPQIHDKCNEIRAVESEENDSQYKENWLESYTSEELRDYQLADASLKPIITWLEAKENPSKNELFKHSPATKALWLCQSKMKLVDGVLFYNWDVAGFSSLRFVVPEALQGIVLKFCHDVKLAGHLGIEKTQKRLRESFLWYNMTTQAKAYVMACKVCNVNKKSCVHAKARLKSYYAGFPMERVHLDIVGPISMSSSGNSYILVIIDQFSKWVDCVALPDQKAERVAYEFFVRFVANFGCPVEIHTDQGRNFDGDLFKAFCELLEITKTRTTPYHPSSNGQVERYNRILLQMVRCYIESKSMDWDKHLPWLVCALRATENRQTGFTPNRLMLGREVLKPLDILLGISSTKFTKEYPPDWVLKLEKSLIEAHKFARDFLQSSQLRQKRDYDVHLKESKFEVGDLVYRLDESAKVGVSSKLRPPWKGPYIIIKQDPPLFKIKDRKSVITIHHDKLKLCLDGSIPMWARRARHELFEDTCMIDSQLEDRNEREAVPSRSSIVSDEANNDDISRQDLSNSGSDLDISCNSSEADIVTKRGRKVKKPNRLDL
jgi:predicted aspartyl protease